MARNDGPIRPDDDSQFYRAGRGGEQGAASSRRTSRSQIDESPDLDDRVVDLGDDQESPFLRAQKRVPVRRGALPKKTATRLRIVLLMLVVLAVLGGAASMIYNYGSRSWRFRLESSDNIELSGAHHVTRSQILQIMAQDISKNVFQIPLEQRRKQVEEIPWVESASVMRLLPNRIKVDIKERTPIAFAQLGSRIELVDANGVLMPTSESQADYSFPVIIGMSATDPLSVRSAQMRLFSQLIHELDSNNAHYSQDVNEVDLSDPDDVKITVADSQGAVLIHLGSSNFLDRYKIYVAHVQEWRQQYPKLNSVDLRYDRQVVLNPDIHAAQAAEKAAQAANGAQSGATPVSEPPPQPVPAATKHKPSARHRK